MKPTITSIGGRVATGMAQSHAATPSAPSQSTRPPRRESLSLGVARGSPAPTPSCARPSRWRRPPASVDLGLVDPLVQGMSRTDDLRRDRHDHPSTRPMPTLAIDDQANRALTHFREKLILRPAHDALTTLELEPRQTRCGSQISGSKQVKRTRLCE
jgi:hypothetical protein